MSHAVALPRLRVRRRRKRPRGPREKFCLACVVLFGLFALHAVLGLLITADPGWAINAAMSLFLCAMWWRRYIRERDRE